MKKAIFAVARALLLLGGILGLQACFEEEYVDRGPYYGHGYRYRYESPWREFEEHEHHHHWHHDDDD